jgi:hypothetical protein
MFLTSPFIDQAISLIDWLGSWNPRFTSLGGSFLWLNRNSTRNPRADSLRLHFAVFSWAGFYSSRQRVQFCQRRGA